MKFNKQSKYSSFDEGKSLSMTQMVVQQRKDMLRGKTGWQEKAENYAKSVDVDLTNLMLLTQGRIRYGTPSTKLYDPVRGENIGGVILSFTASAVAGTEFPLAHNLSTTPIGYITLRARNANDLFDGTTAWTDTTMYLRSSTGKATFTALIIA